MRVPETGFGGEVNVDWVDAAGTTLESQHYEARDAQFALDVPGRRPREVRVLCRQFAHRLHRDRQPAPDRTAEAETACHAKPRSHAAAAECRPGRSDRQAAAGAPLPATHASAGPHCAHGASTPRRADASDRMTHRARPAAPPPESRGSQRTRTVNAIATIARTDDRVTRSSSCARPANSRSRPCCSPRRSSASCAATTS